MQFDQTVVGALLSPAALANYAVARRISRYITLATSSVQDPILTRAAAMREEPAQERGAFARKGYRLVTLLVVPMSLAVAVSAPWLMRVIGGAKYASAWPLLAVLAAGQIVYALYSYLGLHVFVIRPPWFTLLLDGVVGLVSYGAAPWLIRVGRAYGVAGGQIFAFGLGLVTAILILRPHPELTPDRSVWKLLWLPLLASLLPVALLEWYCFRLWAAPIYFAAGAVVFFWLLLRRLPDSEYEAVSRWIPPGLRRPAARLRGAA